MTVDFMDKKLLQPVICSTKAAIINAQCAVGGQFNIFLAIEFYPTVF